MTRPGDEADGADGERDERGADDAHDRAAAIEVTVTRSGGFTGLRREWRAAPPADEQTHWVALIEGCPWDSVAPGSPPLGADLFVWRISARCATDAGAVERDAELQDPQVRGPWQTLIDEVRAASASASSA